MMMTHLKIFKQCCAAFDKQDTTHLSWLHEFCHSIYLHYTPCNDTNPLPPVNVTKRLTWLIYVIALIVVIILKFIFHIAFSCPCRAAATYIDNCCILVRRQLRKGITILTRVLYLFVMDIKNDTKEVALFEKLCSHWPFS